MSAVVKEQVELGIAYGLISALLALGEANLHESSVVYDDDDDDLLAEDDDED